MKYDILMFNMSGYFDFESGFINNRNRKIWEELEKRDDVHRILAVDFLPFTVKTAVKTWLKAGIWRGGKLFQRLRKIRDKSLVYSTVTSFLRPADFVVELREVCQRVGLGRDHPLIVWSYNPLNLAGWLDLPAHLRVFDAVDNWSKHSNFRNFEGLLENAYKIIEQRSDVIFTVASDLVHLFPRNNHVSWIPNGVDTKHFQPSAHWRIPPVLSGLPRPMVGYVGIIQDRLDVDLLEEVVAESPGISWIFVGPTWPVFLKSLRPKPLELKRLDRFSNVHFVGVQPYREIPAFLQAFDAVIIPHKRNAFTRSMNPLKLYEYLSMGKPVVSTDVAGLEDFVEHVSVASSAAEFLHQVREVIAHDSDHLRKKRRDSVRDVDWSRRVGRMMELIEAFRPIRESRF